MVFLNNLKEQSLLIIPNNLKTKVLEEIDNGNFELNILLVVIHMTALLL